MNALVAWLRSDRGAILADPLAALATGLLALAHHDPATIATLALVLVPVLAGMAAGAGRWEWDCGGKVLLVEKNAARDSALARVPEEGIEKTTTTHTGEKVTAVTWQWEGDKRVFLIPANILETFITAAPLARDLILIVSHMYREQGFPADRVVVTSYRKLAENLGLAWGGTTTREDLENALLVARWYTIQNHPVIRKIQGGKVKEKGEITFGFISWWERLTMVDGRNIPRNKQPLRICLTEPYAWAIVHLPPAPVPALALEAAHKAPRRLKTPVKNLIYYLAARVPLERVSLSTNTLAEILGFQNSHRTELIRSIENVIKVLHPVMVKNYDRKDDVYEIHLTGKAVPQKGDTPRGY
ncbi:hypothetical protein [Desulfovirgula thermocuniculi]|uniref:hypothetical protein n=1 Tax=Desulfovirgula thermocuniculi TaxID=348842 RepID=UPI0004077DD1|nr:hypothetical protein [Desulfovirgula thermocuniculi]